MKYKASYEVCFSNSKSVRNPNASLMRTNLTRQQMKGAFDLYFISQFPLKLRRKEIEGRLLKMNQKVTIFQV